MKEKRVQISLSHVAKSFGKKEVLKDVNLEVYEGESVVIIGGSGTGKSVTLKCLLGLVTPDQGTIQMSTRNIGMLFQGAALLRCFHLKSKNIS